jgi:hypothetical protein
VTRPPVKRRRTPAPAADPLVVAVLQAVGRATATRSPPYYVSVDSLGLPQDPDHINAAILIAVLAGYLTAGGNPPHSVAITEDGRRLLSAAWRDDGPVSLGIATTNARRTKRFVGREFFARLSDVWMIMGRHQPRGSDDRDIN